jgi:tRNA threonylcarbamoyladenosine biosynthesis protein TsaE
MKASGRRLSHRRAATRVIRSRSANQTRRLGQKLAVTLKAPAVVLLCGSLGSGKTTLTQGIAQGLGLQDPAEVHSPSFTIVNMYQGHCPIYHVDLYRLTDERDLNSVGLEDFLGRDGITIIEWGERLASQVDVALKIDIQDAGGDSRILHIHQTAARERQKS